MEWQVLESRINATLAQLEKLMLATRQVSDNLAHDLRAPLTRLRARLEAQLAKTDNDELAAALDDVDGLLKSFNALLTLSRLDSGIATLEAWPVNINELLDELHDLFAPLFEDNDMMLQVSGGDDLKLHGDANLLGQALVNLLKMFWRMALKSAARLNWRRSMRATRWFCHWPMAARALRSSGAAMRWTDLCNGCQPFNRRAWFGAVSGRRHLRPSWWRIASGR